MKQNEIRIRWSLWWKNRELIEFTFLIGFFCLVAEAEALDDELNEICT